MKNPLKSPVCGILYSAVKDSTPSYHCLTLGVCSLMQSPANNWWQKKSPRYLIWRKTQSWQWLTERFSFILIRGVPIVNQHVVILVAQNLTYRYLLTLAYFSR